MIVRGLLDLNKLPARKDKMSRLQQLCAVSVSFNNKYFDQAYQHLYFGGVIAIATRHLQAQQWFTHAIFSVRSFS